MIKQPLTTVLITAYNTNPRYLNEAVKSVVDQDYPNLDVLIVDDGSLPKLDARLDYKNHPLVKYEYIPHKGLPYALIHGVELSKAEYIAILDHDDVLKEKSLSRRVKVLESENVGLVYGDIEYIDGNGMQYSIQHYRDYSLLEDFVKAILVNPVGPIKHSGTMFRMDAIKNAGNYNPNMPVDFDSDLIVRVATKFGFKHIPELVVSYRTHNTNVTSKLDYRIKCLRSKWKMIDNYIRDPSKRFKYKVRTTSINLCKFLYEIFSFKKPQWVLNLFRLHSNLS